MKLFLTALISHFLIRTATSLIIIFENYIKPDWTNFCTISTIYLYIYTKSNENQLTWSLRHVNTSSPLLSFLFVAYLSINNHYCSKKRKQKNTMGLGTVISRSKPCLSSWGYSHSPPSGIKTALECKTSMVTANQGLQK